ncbi:MAG: hypothetical protein H6985_03150 [Pseudomonadales bacterium]|nr:hypothetical protein [Pseudomonadales bacterium]
MTSTSGKPRKAILIVHGVGAQAPGESSEKLLHGLGLVPGTRTSALQTPDGAAPVDAEVAGIPVRLYEVHWADLLQGEITRGTFSAREFQAYAWFPWLNRKRRVNPPGKYAMATTLIWTLLLPPLSLALALPYYGARLLVSAFDRDFREKLRQEGRESARGNFWQIARSRADSAAFQRTWLEDTIDEYVGDVFNYVNSAGNARYPDGREIDVPHEVQAAYPKIAERFHTRLIQAAAECAEIQVLAHSLGTVVSYHGLFGLKRGDSGAQNPAGLDAARKKVTHFYTIGSPLEKIGFFWPKLTNPQVPAGGITLQWENFVSWFDPVAGVLKNFDQWGVVGNQRLLGGGFVTGHVVYERHPKFLKRLVSGLGGGEVEIDRTPWQKFRNWALLLGETLLAPVALLLITVAGAAIWLAVVVMLPWLVSLLFRPEFMPQLDPVIFDRASVGLGVLMTLVFLINSRVGASRIHRAAWLADSAGADEVQSTSRRSPGE